MITPDPVFIKSLWQRKQPLPGKPSLQLQCLNLRWYWHYKLGKSLFTFIQKPSYRLTKVCNNKNKANKEACNQHQCRVCISHSFVTTGFRLYIHRAALAAKNNAQHVASACIKVAKEYLAHLPTTQVCKLPFSQTHVYPPGCVSLAHSRIEFLG